MKEPKPIERKADGSYVALLDPHAYSHMETSCVSHTKTLSYDFPFPKGRVSLRSQKALTPPFPHKEKPLILGI